jgi:hypothetical protein
LLLIWLVGAGLALADVWTIPGQPFAHEAITVTTQAVGPTSTLCRVGGVSTGSETDAIIQVTTNGIYYRIDSATATPVATSHWLATNDLIRVRSPSRFRAVSGPSGNANVAVTCVQ